MGSIHWFDDYDQALETARGEGKPILVDFFNPN